MCGPGFAFRVVALTLVMMLVMGIVAPQSAYAQFGFGNFTALFNQINSVANSILTFINNPMRPILLGVQSAAQLLQGFLGQLRSLWEDVVWPVSEINRARGLAQQLIANFRGLLNGLYRVDVRSAQLPNPGALESVVRNRQTGDHAALVGENGAGKTTLARLILGHENLLNLDYS